MEHWGADAITVTEQTKLVRMSESGCGNFTTYFCGKRSNMNLQLTHMEEYQQLYMSTFTVVETIWRWTLWKKSVPSQQVVQTIPTMTPKEKCHRGDGKLSHG